MTPFGSSLVLAGASGFAHPLISAATIFLMAALLGAKLFSETNTTNAYTRLSLLVGISGIASLGAIVVASGPIGTFGRVAGVLAIALATTAAVGGFLMTRRLLSGTDTKST